MSFDRPPDRLSPLRYLRELATPDRSRWKPMMMALGVALAGVQLVAFLEPPQVVSAVVATLVLVAWLVGAFAMVGYLRWFIASEVARGRQDAKKD